MACIGTTLTSREVSSAEIFDIKKQIYADREVEKEAKDSSNQAERHKEAWNGLVDEIVVGPASDGPVKFLHNRAFVNLYFGYVTRAEKKHIPFELTFEDFWDLTQADCLYCGDTKKQVKQTGEAGWHGKYFYNGIDRIDSDGGYTVGNTVPCCGKCNRAKFTMTIDEFKAHVKKMYEHMFL